MEEKGRNGEMKKGEWEKCGWERGKERREEAREGKGKGKGAREGRRRKVEKTRK